MFGKRQKSVRRRSVAVGTGDFGKHDTAEALSRSGLKALSVKITERGAFAFEYLTGQNVATL